MTSINKIYQIPFIANGYSDYFLVADNEKDDPNFWSKVEFEGLRTTFDEGDIIITI